MKFDVIASTKTYEWDDICLIGDLYIDIGGSAFQSAQWADSVSEVLIMWQRAF